MSTANFHIYAESVEQNKKHHCCLDFIQREDIWETEIPKPITRINVSATFSANHRVWTLKICISLGPVFYFMLGRCCAYGLIRIKNNNNNNNLKNTWAGRGEYLLLAEDICKVCCHKRSLRRLDILLKISTSVATSPAEERPRDLLKKYPAVSRLQMLKSLVWQLSHLQKLVLANVNLDQNLFHPRGSKREEKNAALLHEQRSCWEYKRDPGAEDTDSWWVWWKRGLFMANRKRMRGAMMRREAAAGEAEWWRRLARRERGRHEEDWGWQRRRDAWKVAGRLTGE